MVDVVHWVEKPQRSHVLAKAGGPMRSLLHRGYTSAIQPVAERQAADDMRAANEHEVTLSGLSAAVESVLRSYLKRRKP